MSEEVEALEAEVEAEQGEPGTVTVELAGSVEVRVKHQNQWKSRGLSALQRGDFETWAETCLEDGDYELWQDADPTLAEVNAFFDAMGKATGQDVGKSPRSGRSSKSTRKR